MTNLTANFQGTFNKNFQEDLGKITNSPKTNILLWTNQVPKNSFILKKDGKKYLGLLRKDKKGGDYWKFKEIGGKKSNSLESSPIVDKVAKFEQRQEQVKNYGNNSHENKE